MPILPMSESTFAPISPSRLRLTPSRSLAKEIHMGVLVILEMDGPTDALLTAAADLEARRPAPAVSGRMVAPTESGVVVATFWDSAEARDAHQSAPEHGEALRASGLLDAVTEMRSRVFGEAARSFGTPEPLPSHASANARSCGSAGPDAFRRRWNASAWMPSRS